MATEFVIFEPTMEILEAHEAQLQQDINMEMRKIRETTQHTTGRQLRSVHAKSHGVLHGELTVLSGLPPELAQGLFARPATYKVVMRLSTTPGDILDDNVSTPRGLAVKVLGVEGARVIGSERDSTQDFVLIDSPIFQSSTLDKFHSALKMLASTTDVAEPAKKIASKFARASEAVLEAVGKESATLKSLGGHPETHILGENFYSAAPVLYGRYIAKIGVFPIAPDLLALQDAQLTNTGEQNALRNLVHDWFKARGGEWELRVQLCTDLGRMPIEDASVAWPEEESPYLPVASIKAPPQDTWNDKKINQIDAALAFSPWHALAAHRPLGAIMRARKSAYQESAAFRGAAAEPNAAD